LDLDFRAITITDIPTGPIIRTGILITDRTMAIIPDRTIAIIPGRTMDTGHTVITATTVIPTVIIGNEVT
jgi:hypothetical protein